MRMKPGRNDPCSCGSGKKYKNCCLGKAVLDAPRPSAPAPDQISRLDTLFGTGRYAELENHARSLLNSYPDSGIVWKLLGLSLHMQGKDALHAMQKASELLPNDAEAHGNLAALFRTRGQFESAEASGRRALQIKPKFAEGHYNLGITLKELGRLDEPAASYRRAIEIRPDFAEAQNNLGNTLIDLGRMDEAQNCFRRALELRPGFAEAHNNLGVMHERMGELDAAASCYRKAAELKTDYAEAHNNLGVVMQSLGQPDTALACYRKALDIKPDFARAYSNQLFVLAYQALTDPRDYLALARNWELTCISEQDRRLARERKFHRLPLAGRRLKVGYVSGDYRQHAVSYFMEQLFEHHDRSHIELFAFSTHRQRDAVLYHWLL